jgi:hypothetical protein
LEKAKTGVLEVCLEKADPFPLLVREQDDILDSVAFEEGSCLGDGCDRKEGLD